MHCDAIRCKDIAEGAQLDTCISCVAVRVSLVLGGENTADGKLANAEACEDIVEGIDALRSLLTRGCQIWSLSHREDEEQVQTKVRKGP